MYKGNSKGEKVVAEWLRQKGRQPFAFQAKTWNSILAGESGLVNAPTGCGKTYAVFLGAVIRFINEHPDNFTECGENGLKLLRVSPLRSLAKDIGRAMEEAIRELGLQ